jgi:lipopolysaccharide assembly outer membrane protein LptD (OstA)
MVFKTFRLLHLNALLTFLILLISISAFSQSLVTKNGKKLEILHAGSLIFDESLGNGAKRLIGDVQFKHEDVLMFCDSAYFYNDNSLEAFSNVHINQNDSVHLYGDHLKYTGNDRKAVITNNVIVHKGDMKLYTNELNYDMNSGIGYYLISGRIVNKENELISKQGHYYSKTNDVYFKKDVVLTHLPVGAKKPDLIINCDTMRYNSISKITYFYGSTTIKNDDNLIYCEDGWYNTEKELSRFSKNSYLLTSEQKMLGDSVFYDGKQNIGRAFGNVQIIDSTQNTTIKGDYAIHYELTNLSIVTGQALFIKPFTKDTLFLHADTLKALGVKKKEEVKSQKTEDRSQKLEDRRQKSGKEKEEKIKKAEKKKEKKGKSDNQVVEIKKEEAKTSVRTDIKTKNEDENHLLFAYHRVKFFKKDFQGKCDSLFYSTSDSIMKMYGKPIFWSGENQLTADSAKLHTSNKSIKSIELQSSAFMVSEKDSVHYDQVRGKNMQGFFQKNDLQLIKVIGNGQTIYYDEEDKQLRAVNRADCTNIDIYMKDNDINRIVFITKPDATLFPIDEIDVREFKLKGFIWRVNERPTKLTDIFIW